MDNIENKGLKFNLFDVTRIIFERVSSGKEYTYKVNVKHALISDKENSANFDVYFHIDIKSVDENKPLNIQVETVAYFSIIGEFPDEVIANYKNISAPSIVYPYVRAFLSNLTLQAGLNPITLPPINFATYIRQKEEENEG